MFCDEHMEHLISCYNKWGTDVRNYWYLSVEMQRRCLFSGIPASQISHQLIVEHALFLLPLSLEVAPELLQGASHRQTRPVVPELMLCLFCQRFGMAPVLK